MPTYPKSEEAAFINVEDGKVLSYTPGPFDVFNIGCISSKPVSIFQYFKLDEPEIIAWPLIVNYTVNCNWDYKCVTRSPTTNNIYAGTPGSSENKKFFFFMDTPIPHSENLKVSYNHDLISVPPQPFSLTDPGTSEYVKHNYTLDGETIVPFIYVEENNKPYYWQALNSPYYSLKKYQYYKCIDAFSMGYGIAYENSKTTMTGLTYTHRMTLLNTLGVEQTISGQFSVSDPTKKASISFGSKYTK